MNKDKDHGGTSLTEGDAVSGLVPASTATARHTTGPWEWDKDGLFQSTAIGVYRTSVLHAIQTGNWSRVADHPKAIVETDSGHYGPHGADRDLIAAAPELLEALKLAENYVHLWMEMNTGKKELDDLGVIEAAIAKAEGRAK